LHPREFEILAHEQTPLGLICLRRRLTLQEPRRWVTLVTLNHEFLMSSLHTDSEQALAHLAIDRVTSDTPHNQDRCLNFMRMRLKAFLLSTKI
jgi:hypothetical protein